MTPRVPPDARNKGPVNGNNQNRRGLNLLVDDPRSLQAAAGQRTKEVIEGVGSNVDGMASAAIATVTDSSGGGLAIRSSDSDGLVAKRVRGLVDTVASSGANSIPEGLRNGYNVRSVVLASVLVTAGA